MWCVTCGRKKGGKRRKGGGGKREREKLEGDGSCNDLTAVEGAMDPATTAIALMLMDQAVQEEEEIKAPPRPAAISSTCNHPAHPPPPVAVPRWPALKQPWRPRSSNSLFPESLKPYFNLTWGNLSPSLATMYVSHSMMMPPRGNACGSGMATSFPCMMITMTMKMRHIPLSMSMETSFSLWHRHAQPTR